VPSCLRSKAIALVNPIYLARRGTLAANAIRKIEDYRDRAGKLEQ
jgi:hypothetical protein